VEVRPPFARNLKIPFETPLYVSDFLRYARRLLSNLHDRTGFRFQENREEKDLTCLGEELANL
jgi:hypothetical protein